MPEATGQGGTGELVPAGSYLPGSLLPAHVPSHPYPPQCYAGVAEAAHTCSLCQRRLASPCQKVPGRSTHPNLKANIQGLTWGSRSPAALLQHRLDPAEVFIPAELPVGSGGDGDFSGNLGSVCFFLGSVACRAHSRSPPESTPPQTLCPPISGSACRESTPAEEQWWDVNQKGVTLCPMPGKAD